MRYLEKGVRISTMLKETVVVDELLGQGGRADVYRVQYKEKPAALKLFKPGSVQTSEMQHLQKLVKRWQPSDRFLWPLDVVASGQHDGFVMPLLSPEYKAFSDLLNSRISVDFASFRAAVTAALELAQTYRELHAKAFIFPYLSPFELMIKPETGSILIGNGEETLADGETSNLCCLPRFSAPEIVRGEGKPSVYTDRYSLALLIFMLLTRTHPLEGRRYFCSTLMTPEQEKQFYGTDPRFILDPDDDSNCPVAGVQIAIGKVWPELPDYMKKMFTRQFGKDVLMDPKKRATETEWLKLLLRFRSEIIPCAACGAESFGWGSDAANPVCSCCGKRLPVQRYAKSSRIDYSIPLMPGTAIYRSQLAAGSIDAFGAPILIVRRHPKDESILVMTNVSAEELTIMRENEPKKTVPPKGSFAAVPGTRAEAFGGALVIF